jgi:methionyl-tRNA formyltransferase
VHILLLSPRPEALAPAILAAGDSFSASNEDWRAIDPASFDWVVSYNYLRVIKEPWLSLFPGRMINIHISMLPWNRGKSPNLFSWLHGTPKGVSIHEIDKGIDTGDILCQARADLSERETLRTSYDKLQIIAAALFAENWNAIRVGKTTRTKQLSGSGDYNSQAAFLECFRHFPLGYDTPVAEVVERGRAMGLQVHR